MSATRKAFDRLKATDRLPSPRGVAAEVMRLTQSPDCGHAELARTIQRDAALTARLLRAANAPVMALRRPVVAVGDAVLVLGLSAVRQLVLSFSLVESYREGCKVFPYERYWSGALLRALMAQELSRQAGGVPAEELFVCGLLADIGRLAFASAEPVTYMAILEAAADNEPALLQAESKAFGLNHWDLSCMMMQDWALPGPFVDAVGMLGNDLPLPGLTPRAQQVGGGITGRAGPGRSGFSAAPG